MSLIILMAYLLSITHQTWFPFSEDLAVINQSMEKMSFKVEVLISLQQVSGLVK